MENLTPAQKQLYDWLIQYISTNKHSPSIREMMKAMNLRSPAPIQSRLEKMRTKGYIDWSEGQARTLKILKNYDQGLSLLGKITQGRLIEPFNDKQEKIDFNSLFNQSNCYALQVVGDSMSEDKISEGDYVIMRSVSDIEEVKEGEIVAAKVEGKGVTLKRISMTPDKVILKASNPNYESISVLRDQVEIQGVLQGVFRLFNS
ncbi:SOS-response repressor and protease LexA [Geminocystis sp. NIES-3708]|uniref:transcriptional repressor LexA n=1 Tax=Geminocystis sp. NIES-3708 TaxID=1615909 RepID=UPI0005FCDB1C|nr:transcriptional repressor LexA [Geminocystis sp. NIES-3708]BAQ59936.1 SOS-response repressor and protease LexA [Geminocystis sp. NIES-3708]